MLESKRYFPLFIDLNEKECLVVGGGKIALRKTKTLLDYGAKVTLVSPEIKEEFYSLPITIIKESFIVDYLNEKFLVVAATDNPPLNEMIYDICELKGILINNITSKVDMNARFGALVENDEFQIAISAKGDPKKSVALKKEIERFLDDYE
ncbi:precorrin-2 dehydrogenase / sirohydrochlorin ferrochelatase [Cetobacterium ceti]|uniref:precorrin-2 dehydrogenase n=1 Tax=Cetobacterium ceti TaxID=180163 RepID=A0A1T4PLI7_9FUSO|nr:bifunctional precorrin-2 dehydrogenase/sirohydrochlorin ferrochelatase [Cetobacterium ceti]SJZ92433.1 precorrin-2 dehydrogenase / sirohydrochlorin ferrochelatase [Cetobacterium ceti]